MSDAVVPVFCRLQTGFAAQSEKPETTAEPPNTLMARLKDTTRCQHAAVERLVDLDRLGASAALYQRWLQRLYGLYAPLEDGLARLSWTVVGLDFDARRKTALLVQDLTALGSYDEVARMARCQQLPTLTTLAQGLGCLYVLEGATLGGRIIVRRLSARLPISAQHGGRFYHCYGLHGGKMWQQFGQAATAYAALHPECTQSILDAAGATFRCFEQWLSEWELPNCQQDFIPGNSRLHRLRS